MIETYFLYEQVVKWDKVSPFYGSKEIAGIIQYGCFCFMHVGFNKTFSTIRSSCKGKMYNYIKLKLKMDELCQVSMWKFFFLILHFTTLSQQLYYMVMIE
jgi:hypothetical protein